MLKRFLILLIFYNAGCNPDKTTSQERKLDSLYIYHLTVLEDIANNDFIDKGLSARESIAFFDSVTNMQNLGDGNIIAKYIFTLEDLDQWRNWYKSNKGSLVKAHKRTINE
ncbi:MAG: hypothetical protein RJQ09_20710 [Cyclobacteriaceae bacterium]